MYQIESGILIPPIPREFSSQEVLVLYAAHTHGYIQNRRELWKREMIKLLREEWLKIDKNIFLCNILLDAFQPRGFSNIILAGSLQICPCFRFCK